LPRHRVTTRCLVIFVAVDDDGRSAEVPHWEPLTDDDRAAEALAVRRITGRADIEASMAAQHYTDAGTAPRVVLRFLAAPTDVNWGGKVHGGIVMEWIDEAAHVLATRWTGDVRNVAVYAGGVRFYRPLRIGHLVEVEARLLHTGTTSMHISVPVRSGDPATTELELTTHGLIGFVPLTPDGHAHAVRAWVPVSDEDVALEAHALELVALRGAVERRSRTTPEGCARDGAGTGWSGARAVSHVARSSDADQGRVRPRRRSRRPRRPSRPRRG